MKGKLNGDLMLFGKGRQKGVEREPAPYANFVVKKVIPSLSTQRDIILDTARKLFLMRMYESGADHYGHATAQMVALPLGMRLAA